MPPTADALVSALNSTQVEAIHALLAVAADAAPFPDQLLADLDRPQPGFAAIVDHLHHGWYAQASAIGPDAVQIAVVPEPDATAALLPALLDGLRRRGPTRVTWWTNHPGSAAAAANAGMVAGRTLLQMSVVLPVDGPTPAPGQHLRTFVVGEDEAPWLALNRAAFAWHPEQGGWTADTLAQRQQMPWWDPSGFVLLEEAGRLVGWCWTKVHDDLDPAIGEIYVIGVDPDAHGRGLGETLTRAGLAVLAQRVTTAMLYVDGDNHPARRLYHRLGFDTVRTMQAFTLDLGHPAPNDVAGDAEAPHACTLEQR